MHTPPSRRSALRWGALAGLMVLGGSGCGLRLERDAPPIPLIPPVEPHPAIPALREQWTVVTAAATAAAVTTAAPGPARNQILALRAIHADQARVLEQRLAEVGAPLASVSQTTNPGKPENPATPGGSGGVLALRAAQARGIGMAARLAVADVPPSDRALVAALIAQRASAWMALTPYADAAPVPPPPGKGPEVLLAPDGHPLLPAAGWTPSGTLAARLVDAAAAARYGAQVIAARAADSQAHLARSGVDALSEHALRVQVAAQSAGLARAPVLGYRLPFAVATAGDVARLARHVWSGWAQAVMAALVPAAPAAPAPAPVTGTGTGTASRTSSAGEHPHSAVGGSDASALLGWLVEAELSRQRWQAPALAFPGLSWPR